MTSGPLLQGYNGGKGPLARCWIKRFKIIDHTADTGIDVYGQDVEELFAHAAQGLFQIITDLEGIREAQMHQVEAMAPDQEALLVAWLNEFIYRFDVESLLFRRFEIERISDTVVRGKAFGERVDPGRHLLKTGVKSATYHELKISHGAHGYKARVILDI